MRFLDRAQPFALTVLRVVLGAVLIAHGQPKVFGGLHQHMAYVGKLGMPAWFGYLSAGTEFVGGILLIVGLLTRLVGVAVFIEMLVAIFKVHLKHGLAGSGGYDFPLSITAISFLFIFYGAGPISLDWLFNPSGESRR
ncbi:MAG: DoxX family protein [Terriglobales bacterium]